MNKTDRLAAALLEASERNTRPRQAIAKAIAALGEKGGAFSIEELIKELGRSKPRIGRATVYRTIEKLVGLKVLDRIEFADGARAYRLCDSEKHHHHLTCTSCHRVVEFDLCIPQAKIDAIGRRESFTIEDHEISLYGLCAKCRGKLEAPAR